MTIDISPTRYTLKLPVFLLLFGLSLSQSTWATIFQAENYSDYYDTTPGNAGGEFRNDDVDIQATIDLDGGYNVGWIAAQEWLAFSDLTILHSGEYLVRARVASPNGGTVSLDLNAGSIALATLQVPNTGGWQNWQTVESTVNIAAGEYSLGVYAVTGDWNLNWIEVVPVATPTTTPTPTPSPSPNPGEDILLQAEDFSAYFDATEENIGGAYRDEAVDIANANDDGNGFYVGWWDKNEWLRFDNLTFIKSGNYRVNARVASLNGGTLSFDLDGGQHVLGQLDIYTNGWQNWQTLSFDTYIEAGQYNLGIFSNTGNVNLNWLSIEEIERNNDGIHTADRSRGEWTLLTIPDTQHYSQNRANAPIAHMRAAFDWIVDNKQQLNIQFVQGLGDITEGWNVKWEWDNSTSAWYKLLGQVPFLPAIGNHDDPYTMNQYFPVSMFSSEPWWGGNSAGIENSYGLMTIYNEDYLFLQVETYDQYSTYDPTGLDFARGVLSSYPNRKVILATHDTWATTTIKDNLLTKFDNIVLSNAGHTCQREALYQTQGPGGGVAHNFITDYQCDAHEVMMLRYYLFKPMEDRVEYYTYSPVTQSFEVDESSQGSFYLQQEDP